MNILKIPQEGKWSNEASKNEPGILNYTFKVFIQADRK